MSSSLGDGLVQDLWKNMEIASASFEGKRLWIDMQFVSGDIPLIATEPGNFGRFRPCMTVIGLVKPS